jgi:hypothetical protein
MVTTHQTWTPVKPIRYTSVVMRFQVIGMAVVALIGLMMLTGIFTGNPETGVSLMLYGLWMAVVILAVVFFTIRSVETTDAALLIHYWLRPTTSISWGQIQEVAVRHYRGAFVAVRYGPGLFDRVRIPVDPRWFSTQISDEAMELLQVIVEAAGLTEQGRTPWYGQPIFRR